MLQLSEAPSDVSRSSELAVRSFSFQSCTEIPSERHKNGLVLLTQPGDCAGSESFCSRLNSSAKDLVENSFILDSLIVPTTQLANPNGTFTLKPQRLSPIIGTEVPCRVSVPDLPCKHPNADLPSSRSSFEVDGCRTISYHGDTNSQIEVRRNYAYGPLELSGANHDQIKLGTLKDSQSDISPNAIYLSEASGSSVTILNSKYLIGTQELLDETVNVRDALMHCKLDKRNLKGFGTSIPTKADASSPRGSKPSTSNGISSDCDESITNSSCEPSPAEQQDLQNKKAKLLSMIDEVDRIYKHYHYQMQILISSFEMVSGFEAAKPYTALALWTISRHFRCLRDAILGQVQVMQKGLGDNDSALNAQRGITRLRYVDQQLKQQRVLQHLGVMPPIWRPQRGLPESSVSILRAWLFEHFLHPYPKDSEKAMLAKQTGLTRSQVANWFINARVRLWKPMVEEIYREEFNDVELHSKSSSENAIEAGRDNSWASETDGDKMNKSAACRAVHGGHPQEWLETNELNTNLVPDLGLNGQTKELSHRVIKHLM